MTAVPATDASAPQSPVWRTFAILGALLILAALLWTNFSKGYDGTVQGWGRPYWWMDYGHGLVRRGLAGTVFQAILGRRDEAGLKTPLEWITLSCFGLMALSILWPLARGFWCRPGAILGFTGPVALWVMAAQFWPHIAFNNGYLDALVICWAAMTALTFRAGWLWPCAVMMFMGPLIHEYFVFLVPLILTARFTQPADMATGQIVGLDSEDEQRGRTVPPFVIVAVPAFVSAVLVTFFYSHEATRAEVMAMPLPPEVRSNLISQNMSQTIGQAIELSLGQAFRSVGFTAEALAFLLVPTIVCAAAIAAYLRSNATLAAVRIFAAFAPLAALCVAWDVSRLIVTANFAAGLLFAFSFEDSTLTDTPVSAGTQGSAVRGALAAVLALGALLYALGPMAYMYYPPGPVSFFPLKSWPGDGSRTFGFDHLWHVTEVRHLAR